MSHSPNSNLSRLDALRFLCANMVIISHLLDLFLSPYSGFVGFWSWGNLDCLIGIVPVLFFFILSGYVISFSVEQSQKRASFTFPDYFKKRFFRIFPVAWGAMLVGLVFVLVIKLFLEGHGLGPAGFLSRGETFAYANYLSVYNLLYSIFLPPIGYQGGFFDIPIWSLGYEFGFYVLFGVLLVLKTGRSWSQVLFIGFMILGASFTYFAWNIAPSLAQSLSFAEMFKFFLRHFPVWNFLPGFIIWFYGVLLFRHTKNNPTFKWRTAGSILVVSVLGMLLSHFLLGAPFAYNFYTEVPGVAEQPYSILMTLSYAGLFTLVIYAVAVLPIRGKIVTLFATWGRQYSFTLYATHFFILYLADAFFWNRLASFSGVDFFALFVVLLILANIMARYLAVWLEDRNRWMALYDRLLRSATMPLPNKSTKL